MPTSTLSSKGQITLPKAIRDRLGLVEGDVLEFTVDLDGSIRLRPRLNRGASGVLRDYAPEDPVSVEEMRTAVRGRVRRRSSPRTR
ncbi:MAG: AbrB/MazE/SpoVT family DNA-binding domain-containing protein [Acidobacteria bacterium]|nr:MAG: AbrB/MazE/SpoVT family DNA-binding domain-containing protein [Acidobacteriota bacterium]REK04445.1 MAG: AbrB/MazE/SpoVT family DNA-binding domain-containing protein [Acidobacteriota bacterium]